MRIVFAHTNFPAQFGALGEWLSGEGWQVAFITQRKEAQHPAMTVVRCEDHRKPGSETHHYVRPFERAVITGQAFARSAVDLSKKGFQPDIIMAHSGWGAGVFLKDVWPEAVYVPYFEWHYNWPVPDQTPYDAPKNPLEGRARNHARNAPMWMDFSPADCCICPTAFQAGQFPPWLRSRLTVMHDGVDTDLHSPGDGDRSILKRWNVPDDAEIVTSITWGMEPHRGFPETMRAIALLQKRRPRLHAFVGGEDRVAYGTTLAKGDSWKKRMLAELELDLSRLHFTGILSRVDMVALMRVSGAHIYLTVPFTLSWSLLDPMSVGCLIVASDTEPVREFMADGESGLLCPMNDPEALAARIEEALDHGDGLRPLRAAARATVVETLDAHRVIYPAKKALLGTVVADAWTARQSVFRRP